MEPAIDRLLEIYAAAMAAPPGPGDATRAAAIHCSRIARPLKEAYGAAIRLQALTGDLERARAGNDALQTNLEALRGQLCSVEEKRGERDRELASARDDIQTLQNHIAALQRQIAEFQALPTLRLRDAVLKTPIVGSALQASARRLAKLLSH
jgi:chromosome segregation ATPase